MFTLVTLSLALALRSVTASPLPQMDIGIGDPTMFTSNSPTGTPTVVIDPMPTAPVCAQTYTAVANDTCQSIGTKFGFTAAEIHDANAYLNCDDIWAWTPVCIPEKATSTSTTTSPTPSPTCVATYTAVAGDTCASIAAARNGLTAADILAANPFLNCNDIWAWTPICIPPSSNAPACISTYVSQDNDTCASIESQFGLSVGAIKAANSFLTCDNIWKYTPICIPPGGLTSTMPPTTTPTTTSTSVTPSGTCASIYIAQAGDTCTSIVKGSRSVGREIYLANPTLDCNNIWAGTPVCLNQNAYSYIQTATPTPIPTCAKTYTSVAGDTCVSLGRSFDLAASDISSANSFLNCDNIWAGTSICVPPYTSVPYCKHILHASAGESCYNLSRPYKIGGADVMAVTPGLVCGEDQFGNSNAFEGQEICIPWSTFY